MYWGLVNVSRIVIMYILLEISMIFERVNISNCLEHDESIGDENIRT